MHTLKPPVMSPSLLQMHQAMSSDEGGAQGHDAIVQHTASLHIFAATSKESADCGHF